ncbi:MAG: cell division protein FtsA [bacterium]|nr:cell division protein FtsA [bacterium]
MARKDLLIGIDVGSHKVACVIGRIQPEGIDIIGVGSAKSAGVRKGVVVDLEETISSLSAALEEAERMSGISVNEAVVALNGQHIESEAARGIITVTRTENDISELDVERAVEAARSTSTPPNREIIHSIPQSFIVDGQTGIKDPVGMTGVRLEVETTLITGSTSSLKNLTKCLNQAGVAVSEFVFAPLAVAKAVTTKEQRNVGVLVIDIGADTTGYAIYEEEKLIGTGVIPIGSGHVTNDLAIGLRTSIAVAEKIKQEFGTAYPSDVAEKKLEGTVVGFEGGDIDLVLVAEIIEARYNEILVMVKDVLRKINRDSLLPAGAIFTGGGAKQRGLVSLAKDTLKLPAAVGELTTEVSGMVDNVLEPQYATSVGLLMWAIGASPSIPRPLIGAFGRWQDISAKTKSIFKNIFP